MIIVEFDYLFSNWKINRSNIQHNVQNNVQQGI